MGWGDEIMAIGHAVVTQERDERRRPVRILSLGGLPRWSPVWESQASILRPEDPDPPGGFQAVQNGAGCRPYIKYPFTRESGLTPSGWRARDHWGRLELREESLAFGRALRKEIGSYVVVGVDTGPGASPNKAWGEERYQDLLRRIQDLNPIRLLGPTSTPGGLELIREVKTPEFLDACGTVAASRGYVGAEGGLHHAAAYLSRPAVVIFGGFISPDVTGYPGHVNLTGGAWGSCGKWDLCPHCQKCLQRIKPAAVAEALRRVVAEERDP